MCVCNWSQARVIDGSPPDLSPIATCKNPADSSVAPCLHSAHRTSNLIRTYLFPLNYPVLYLLTQLQRQTFVTPGNFDGYTLAGTCFIGSGSGRIIASVRGFPWGGVMTLSPELLLCGHACGCACRAHARLSYCGGGDPNSVVLLAALLTVLCLPVLSPVASCTTATQPS